MTTSSPRGGDKRVSAGGKRLGAEAKINPIEIPESPSTLELCALVHHPDTLVFEDEGGCVLDNATLELIGIWGAPRTEIVLHRVAAAPAGRSVLAQRPEVAPSLEWKRARLYVLDDDTAPDRLLEHAGRLVRPMVATDLLAIEDVELRAELAHMFQRLSGAIVCSLEGTRPAAFAGAPYRSRPLVPGREGGGLFDLSVDTLPAYRRRGHAQRAVARCLEIEMARGGRPVWGALEDNVASIATATSLGFIEAADEILWVFETG